MIIIAIVAALATFVGVNILAFAGKLIDPIYTIVSCVDMAVVLAVVVFGGIEFMSGVGHIKISNPRFRRFK
jgi:hypothetical protein